MCWGDRQEEGKVFDQSAIPEEKQTRQAKPV